MRLEIDVVLDYDVRGPADVLLQVEVAAMADQRLLRDDMTVTSPEPVRAVPGEEGMGQRCWALGDGQFRVEYSGMVDIDRPLIDLAPLTAADPRDLPSHVIPYLLPSRYCEADKFESFVESEFSGLSGGTKVLAMRDWISDTLRYESGSSSGVTTAITTFVERRGVCRDYAHLLTSMARAAMIPARCVSAYAPNVSPQDFHAVTEVWLEDGWHLLDATRMSHCQDLARVGVGRDATDIAFMTIFGTAHYREQRVQVRAVG